eukprot:190247-Heterocapsa_arctica.AAC.1
MACRAVAQRCARVLPREGHQDRPPGQRREQLCSRLDAWIEACLEWVPRLGSFFLDLEKLALLEPADKNMVYRIKEVRVQNIFFLLRAARLEALQQRITSSSRTARSARGHVRYDVLRDFAKLVAVLAIIVFVLVAENPSALIEEALGHHVARLTEADDFSEEKTV